MVPRRSDAPPRAKWLANSNPRRRLQGSNPILHPPIPVLGCPGARPSMDCPRRDHRCRELEKQSRADAKELAEFSRLRRADASLPRQGLMHMAALSENGSEVRCRFPGVLQEELELLGGGAIVRRECLPAVVVFDQQGQ